MTTTPGLSGSDRPGPATAVSALAAVIAMLVGVLIVAGTGHDTVRLITPDEPRCRRLSACGGRRS
jgi:hypothetical protein